MFDYNGASFGWGDFQVTIGGYPQYPGTVPYPQTYPYPNGAPVIYGSGALGGSSQQLLILAGIVLAAFLLTRK